MIILVSIDNFKESFKYSTSIRSAVHYLFSQALQLAQTTEDNCLRKSARETRIRGGDTTGVCAVVRPLLS